MKVVVDPDPSSSHSVVASEEAVLPPDGTYQINRRMSLACGVHTKPHRARAGNIRDFNGRNRAQTHIGEPVKTRTGWHPNLSRESKDRSWLVIPIEGSREGSSHGETCPAIGANVKAGPRNAVENIIVGPVSADKGAAGKARTVGPVGTVIGGIGSHRVGRTPKNIGSIGGDSNVTVGAVRDTGETCPT